MTMVMNFVAVHDTASFTLSSRIYYICTNSRAKRQVSDEPSEAKIDLHASCTEIASKIPSQEMSTNFHRKSLDFRAMSRRKWVEFGEVQRAGVYSTRVVVVAHDVVSGHASRNQDQIWFEGMAQSGLKSLLCGYQDVYQS